MTEAIATYLCGIDVDMLVNIIEKKKKKERKKVKSTSQDIVQ